MELILGLLSPIIAAILCYSGIRNFNFTKLFAFLLFGITTLYFSITTLGPEGPFYRIYVCLITTILFIIEVVALNSNKEKMRMKLLYSFSLLVIIFLLFFSDGVCSF
jgi:hypothetical protein